MRTELNHTLITFSDAALLENLADSTLYRLIAQGLVRHSIPWGERKTPPKTRQRTKKGTVVYKQDVYEYKAKLLDKSKFLPVCDVVKAVPGLTRSMVYADVRTRRVRFIRRGRNQVLHVYLPDCEEVHTLREMKKNDPSNPLETNSKPSGDEINFENSNFLDD